MRVLVTGATGFIGRALCPALVAVGHEVAAVVRNSGNPGIPERATVHVIPDIGPETEWDQPLSGMDAVIHLAARAHVMEEHVRDPMGEFNRVNAEGTGRLTSAAAKAGIGRFVYLSTVKVMGDHSSAPFRESDTPRPEDAYGKSKLGGEQALAIAAADAGLEPVILRPPIVYGPGVKGNFLALMKLCQAAPPLPFSTVDNRRSIIYVGNLVDAIGRCLTADGAAGETYFVRDDEDVSTPGLIRNVAEALGRPRNGRKTWAVRVAGGRRGPYSACRRPPFGGPQRGGSARRFLARTACTTRVCIAEAAGRTGHRGRRAHRWA